MVAEDFQHAVLFEAVDVGAGGGGDDGGGCGAVFVDRRGAAVGFDPGLCGGVTLAAAADRHWVAGHLHGGADGCVVAVCGVEAGQFDGDVVACFEVFGGVGVDGYFGFAGLGGCCGG